MNYHDILLRLQEYIKTHDISQQDIPNGIEFFASGNVYVSHSFSIKKFDDINSAFRYIDNFLKENKDKMYDTI
jgi:hypothetical protein